MATTLAKGTVTGIWMRSSTKHLKICPELKEAFAEILDDVLAKQGIEHIPTKELLQELELRASEHRPEQLDQQW